MCSKLVIAFGMRCLNYENVKGKRVIELGSQDVNGSLRYYVTGLGPREYIGIDSATGKGVDIVCDVVNAIERFGLRTFDVVICTEMLEHVFDWRKVINIIKGLCVEGGTMVITTRSKGFHYHPYPYDFWRYEIEDMKVIFSDCSDVIVENDPEGGGVFVKANIGTGFIENDLDKHELYRMPESLGTNL